MKCRMHSLLFLFAAIIIGCGSSKDFIKPGQDEINAYIEAHPNLSEIDKSCIYDGRFEIGIRQETVQFLLGEPKKIEEVKQPWAMQQLWIYKKGGKKIFIIEDKHVVGIQEED